MASSKQVMPEQIETENRRSSPVIDMPQALREIESEDRLLGLAQVVWNERRRVLRLAMFASLITLIIGLLTPNTYRSTTRLMPPDNQSGSSLAAMANMVSRVGGGDLGFFAGTLLGMQSTGARFIGVLQSRTAQERLVDQFDLTMVYGHPWLRFRIQKEDAYKQLEYNTEVFEDRKSGIISISVTDHDPKRAAAMANGYVEQLNRLIAGLSTSTAGRERQFLEQRLTEVKKDLDEAARQLSEFSSQNTTLDPKEQGRAMVEAAATLQGELIAAQSQLRGLETIYTANNVRVRSLQARIAELKKQLGNVSGNTNAGAFSPTDAANSDMPFPSIRQLPLLGSTYADLFRRAKIEETIYQVLTQQYELAKVQEAKEIPTVRVLDTANLPRKKWGPHRVLLAIMGAMVGLLFGCAWVIGTDHWRNRDANDPRKAFFSDVFSTVHQNRAWKTSEAILHRVISISTKHRGTNHNNGSNPS